MGKLKTFTKKIFLFIGIMGAFCWLLPTGCAVMVPPTGGPKDTIPPVLLSAVPHDLSVDFDAQSFTLTFNKFIDPSNIFNELIISPIPKHPITVSGKLRTVTIKIKDTLDPNTTYSYDFRNGIKDVTEGNILKNFVYTFSTGKHLDRQSISGRVTLAETDKADSTLLAVLYSDLSDTAVYKTQPKYYTKLDTSGNFTFRFLPKEKFNLFVVANSYMKNYGDSTEQFAFFDSTIDTHNDSLYQHLRLYAFQAYPKKEKSKTQTHLTQKQLEKKKADEAKKPLTVTTDITNGKQSLLKSLQLTYSKPLQYFDSTKILLTDTNFIPKKYTVFRDSTDTTNTRFFVKTDWQEGSMYKLIIPKEAAKDSFDVELSKADTIDFQTKTSDDYASIEFDFPDVDTALNPVLQIFSSDKLLDSMKINASKKVSIPRYEPGKYKLRILYDTNGDMRWTPGNYKERRQPEIVVAIKKEFEFIAGTINQWDIYLKAQEEKKYTPLHF
jgi:hypothetical protein